MSGPLAHLRVLDFTQLLQGPLATQILADLGADVIKFEKPGGEWMRHWGIRASRTHGEMDSFLAFNRNKRSAAVDLKDPAAVSAWRSSRIRRSCPRSRSSARSSSGETTRA